MNDEIDILEVDRIVAEIGRDEASVIPVLQAVQKRFKHLPQAALERVCEITEITPAQIEGVSSFFSQFRRTPVGKHMISVCDGTACHVRGGEQLSAYIQHRLGIGPGETTTDRRFDLDQVACLGCCALSPVVKIDDKIYSQMSVLKLRDVLDEYDNAE